MWILHFKFKPQSRKRSEEVYSVQQRAAHTWEDEEDEEVRGGLRDTPSLQEEQRPVWSCPEFTVH